MGDIYLKRLLSFTKRINTIDYTQTLVFFDWNKMRDKIYISE